MLGLEMESPVYRRKTMRERETDGMCYSCLRTRTQSLGHQGRKDIRRAGKWNDACIEDEDEVSSIAVVFKLLEQKQHQLEHIRNAYSQAPTQTY